MRSVWAIARGRERATRYIERQKIHPIQTSGTIEAPSGLPTRPLLLDARTDVGSEPASASSARLGVLFTLAASLFS
jgi:hypothetical protein